ncbi:DUF2815 family protein [uncultured Thiodictyon sp.]|uniref:DUF2815 family protein n=1 Tax=uncultured Thiodictyon sp. TaxID=1846217 RepID=UPI0025CD4458|nr:DUF2815 family protein [uncultured Thiodictyon sp.]
MSAQTNTAALLKVVTGKCRASYVNVIEPRLNELSGKEEYSMTVLIPKNDKNTLAAIKGAVDTAIAMKWPSRVPQGVQKPVHDGDGPKPNGGDYGPECEGHYVINVKSSHKPGVVDAQLNPIMSREDFQSGDYCRVSLNAYAYDNKRIGVSFGLNNVQVLEKGDPLGGSRTRPEDDFGPAMNNAAELDDDIPF